MSNLLFDHGEIAGTVIASNSVNFTPATTGIYYIGFHAYSDANMNVLVLDEISVTGSVQACSAPSALATSNITPTSAELSWTASPSDPANGYQWEVRSSGIPGDPGPDASGTTAAGTTTGTAT